MNKKANTVLFMLCATVANIVIALGIFFVLFVIFVRFLAEKLSDNISAIMVPVFFVVALAASFVIYNAILKTLVKKIDMEKYFDPIFKPRRR